MTHERPLPDSPSRAIRVRRMAADDVAEVASLHRCIFPDYFLTHMGQRFLERFYGEFVDRPGNHGFVAIYCDRAIGVVIGTSDCDAFYRRFYSRNLGITALTFGRRFLADAHIRSNFVTRMAHVRHALGSVFHRPRGSVAARTASTPSPVPACLLSISVDPDFRGEGIADSLVDCFREQLWQVGVEWVGLSVRPDNHRAIAFYEKTGWQRGQAARTTIQFSRSTRPEASTGDR
jgi:ribosomal protein S18 acetylase RimI-like enzyme